MTPPVLGNYAFTVNLYRFKYRVAQRLGIAVSGLLDGLDVGDAGVALDMFCEIVNRAQDTFLDACPNLGKVTGTINIVAGQRDYAKPSDLFREKIDSLIFSDPGNPYFGVQIPYITPEAFDRLGYSMLASQSSQPWVQNWTLTPDELYIRFAPWPNMNTTVALTYRKQADQFIAADYTDTDSESVFSVPNTFIDVMEMSVAEEMAMRIARPDLEKYFHSRLHDMAAPYKFGRWREAIEALNNIEQNLVVNQFAPLQWPPRGNQTRPFDGGIPSGGFSTWGNSS